MLVLTEFDRNSAMKQAQKNLLTTKTLRVQRIKHPSLK